MARKKMFCEYGPVFYKISTVKEIARRKISNLRSKTTFAYTKEKVHLPCIVASYASPIAESAQGVTLAMLQDKENNLTIAAGKVNELIIRPGETFSFWHTIGNCTKREGYRSGLMMASGKLIKCSGGGLCQLATHIHNLILGSPLEVIELHHHSDALFPDTKPRVPYELGVSVLYNYIDYRFRNNSAQKVQLLFNLTPEAMLGELRSENPFPYAYELIEEDHHFAWEGDECYRKSMIYRNVIERETGNIITQEFLHKLHSKVMYDPAQIPVALFRRN